MYHRVYITSDSGVPAASSSSRGHLRSEPQQQALDREVTPQQLRHSSSYLILGVSGVWIFSRIIGFNPGRAGRGPGWLDYPEKNPNPGRDWLNFTVDFSAVSRKGSILRGSKNKG